MQIVLYFSRHFNQLWTISNYFHLQKFKEILPVRAPLKYLDRRTGHKIMFYLHNLGDSYVINHRLTNKGNSPIDLVSHPTNPESSLTPLHVPHKTQFNFLQPKLLLDWREQAV
jgi:hypothetical protein